MPYIIFLTLIEIYRLDKKIQEIAEMQAQMEGLQQAHEKGNTAITAKEEGQV